MRPETTPPPATTKGRSGSPFKRFSLGGRTWVKSLAHFPPATSAVRLVMQIEFLLVDAEADRLGRNFSRGGLNDSAVDIDMAAPALAWSPRFPPRFFTFALIRSIPCWAIAAMRLMPGGRMTAAASLSASHWRQHVRGGCPGRGARRQGAHLDSGKLTV